MRKGLQNIHRFSLFKSFAEKNVSLPHSKNAPIARIHGMRMSGRIDLHLLDRTGGTISDHLNNGPRDYNIGQRYREMQCFCGCFSTYVQCAFFTC